MTVEQIAVKNKKKEKKFEKTNFFSDLVYDFKNNKGLIIMCLPAIAFFIVFAYLPLIGLLIAFQHFTPAQGLLKSKFVGFDNFKFFLGSPDSLRVTFNTLFLNALFIIATMIVSIIIAVVLSEISGKIIKKTTQSIVMLPHFISWTVVALLLESLLSTDTGFINLVLKSLGFHSIQFYQTAKIWPMLLTVLTVWQGAGYGSIVYLASITGIDQEIFEAAKVDGATRFQCIWHLTLPLLKPTAILLFIMSVGKIFYGNFGMIYAIVGSNTSLYPTTDVIDTYVYRQLMELGDMGMSSAVGLYQSVMGFIMVYITNLIARKISPDSAIF